MVLTTDLPSEEGGAHLWPNTSPEQQNSEKNAEVADICPLYTAETAEFM